MPNTKVASYITVNKKEDGIYLVVDLPDANTVISKSEVLEIIGKYEVKDVDYEAVEFIAGSELKYIEMKISSNLDIVSKPEEGKIEITSDGLRAYIYFIEPLNSDVRINIKDINSLLSSCNITHGIIDGIVDSLLEEREYGKKYLLAVGEEPVNGEDGYLEFLFDVSPKTGKPKIKENGKVDYYDLNLYQIVDKGDILVKSYPPTEGKNGIDVTGKTIEHKIGKPAKSFPRGINVEISEDESMLVAGVSGHISFINNRIIVSPTLEINGSVNSSIGNIDFNGSVIIKGNVFTGFKINASGDIIVHGVVEGAKLKSGAHIFLKNGVQGMDKAMIHAEGDIVAKYIEHSEVIAGNNIVSDSILHSHIVCFGGLELRGKNSALKGGNVAVKNYLIARYIGSPMNTTTEIKVGNDPMLLFKYETNVKELKKLREQILFAEQTVDVLTRLLEQNKLTDKRKNQLIGALKLKIELREKILDLESDIQSFLSKLKNNNGFVAVEDKIYPGVKIIIGNAVLIVRDELSNVKFINYKDRISITTI